MAVVTLLTGRARRAAVLALAAVACAPAAASAASFTDQLDAVAGPAMEGLIRAQREDGTFKDTTKGSVGGIGLTKAAFAASHQSLRLSSDAATSRRLLARRVLTRGTGGSNVLDKWAVALWASAERAADGPLSGRLDARLRELGRLHAPGVADACFQRSDCFNNYSLVSRVLNLELAASGLKSSTAGARLARPALRDESLRWLRDVLPRTTAQSARVIAPGQGTFTAAALSDPHTYPLAYQTLCTALLTRAVTLGGSSTPKKVWQLLRAALWENVGFTAPNGEITYLGRGQDEVWTLAANLYAGVQGSVLFASRDPRLAARLRRVAEIELAALAGRLTDTGLAQTPLNRAGRAGIDHYASQIGNASLALTWLELARDASTAMAGDVSYLPSEVDGGRASDPQGNGLLTLRKGDVWLAVHRRRDHRSDARQDFGLLRALRRNADGRYESLMPERPIVRPGQASPAGGPMLLSGGVAYAPSVTRGGAEASSIRLSGGWGGVASGSWTFAPTAEGVQMTSTCPSGRALQLTVFLPKEGELTRRERLLARGGYTVRFSQPVSATTMSTTYGSAREPRLTALKVRTACTTKPLKVTYTGTVLARG